MSRATPGGWSFPPEGKGRAGKIMTGLLKYTDPNDMTVNFVFRGPPCRAFPLVGDEGVVKFGKCTLVLAREDELEEGASDKLSGESKERVEFTKFIRYVEDVVIENVRPNSSSYFGKEVKSVQIRPSISTAKNPEYGNPMTCKIEISEGSPREDILPQHVLLEIRDVDGVTKVPVSDMRMGDVYLPVFSSVYPYFNRQEMGLQWKLAGLQLIRRGHSVRNVTDSASWVCMSVLQKYKSENGEPAPSILGKRQIESSYDEDV